jgi:hypothetical protein
VYVAPARTQASLATAPFGIATTFFAQIAIGEPVAAHPEPWTWPTKLVASPFT